MAVSRFFRPQFSKPQSMYVPTPLDTDLMLKAGMTQQARYDKTASQMQGHYDEVLGMKALPGEDTKYLKEQATKFNEFAESIAGADLGSPETIRRVTGEIRRMQRDPDLSKISTTYGKHQQYLKNLADAKKDKGWHGLEDWTNEYKQNYLKYTTGEGFRGDIALDPSIQRGVDQYETIGKGYDNIPFTNEDIAQMSQQYGIPVDNVKAIKRRRILERTDELLKSNWMNSISGRQMVAEYDRLSQSDPESYKDLPLEEFVRQKMNNIGFERVGAKVTPGKDGSGSDSGSGGFGSTGLVALESPTVIWTSGSPVNDIEDYQEKLGMYNDRISDFETKIYSFTDGIKNSSKEKNDEIFKAFPKIHSHTDPEGLEFELSGMMNSNGILSDKAKRVFKVEGDVDKTHNLKMLLKNRQDVINMRDNHKRNESELRKKLDIPEDYEASPETKKKAKSKAKAELVARLGTPSSIPGVVFPEIFIDDNDWEKVRNAETIDDVVSIALEEIEEIKDQKIFNKNVYNDEEIDSFKKIVTDQLKLAKKAETKYLYESDPQLSRIANAMKIMGKGAINEGGTHKKFSSTKEGNIANNDIVDYISGNIGVNEDGTALQGDLEIRFTGQRGYVGEGDNKDSDHVLKVLKGNNLKVNLGGYRYDVDRTGKNPFVYDFTLHSDNGDTKSLEMDAHEGFLQNLVNANQLDAIDGMLLTQTKAIKTSPSGSGPFGIRTKNKDLRVDVSFATEFDEKTEGFKHMYTTVYNDKDGNEKFVTFNSYADLETWYKKAIIQNTKGTEGVTDNDADLHILMNDMQNESSSKVVYRHGSPGYAKNAHLDSRGNGEITLGEIRRSQSGKDNAPVGAGAKGFTASETEDVTTPEIGATTIKTVKAKGNPAKRNNSPGNIKYHSVHKKRYGATIGPMPHGFAVFPNPKAGAQALIDQIKLDAGRKHSLGTFIPKYAPKEDGNEPKKYIDHMIKTLKPLMPDINEKDGLTEIIDQVGIVEFAKAMSLMEDRNYYYETAKDVFDAMDTGAPAVTQKKKTKEPLTSGPAVRETQEFPRTGPGFPSGTSAPISTVPSTAVPVRRKPPEVVYGDPGPSVREIQEFPKTQQSTTRKRTTPSAPTGIDMNTPRDTSGVRAATETAPPEVKPVLKRVERQLNRPGVNRSVKKVAKNIPIEPSLVSEMQAGIASNLATAGMYVNQITDDILAQAERGAVKYLGMEPENVHKVDTKISVVDSSGKAPTAFDPVSDLVKTAEFRKPLSPQQVLRDTFPKTESKYRKLGSVPNNDRKGENFFMYSNEFNGYEGFDYVPISNYGNSKLFETKYDNVKGVAHFLLDSDVSGKDKYIHEKSQSMLDRQLRGKPWIESSTVTDSYFPVYEKRDNGMVNVKYLKKNEIADKNKIMSPLRQYRFSDLDWNGRARAQGFKDSVSSIPTKKAWKSFEKDKEDGRMVNESHFLFSTKAGKGSYGRFGGGSVVFILNANDGRRVVHEIAGSIDMIRKTGEELIKREGISADDLIIGYHDVGSFSAKPEAKNGKISYNQWSGFNTNDSGNHMMGGGLAIPK